ncbi:divalent-cation tolerance protein CutA [Dehalogenimonas etheniformans]|uniref:Divalent-cation tolerance protein CutA n=1 Tax=Dehalogenimonas etheniformans TaxID=1536648 RepID=A0A2P5P842_9CHLR|nr:divalent-cation tolerance protein CutA [Dehalogenimonas etheniformans]PPD58478.1 divalent-cation tolerance protein CutA [Dehalogenimonas etheniformans]QNT76757.1 divalent-cation tolerance protein CutA [Dehalogenimonas etheniformans]
MNDFKYMMVMVTAADNEEARLIAKMLLEQKKAACVSIMDGMNSAYWWKGAVENATESLLMVKTKAALLDDIVTAVTEIHSYENPEIIALPVLGGSDSYFEWIDESLEPEAEEPAA